MNKLDRLEARINSAGITTRRTAITTENGLTPVLVAEHDYTGPYPTRESVGKMDAVARMCIRYKGLHVEHRGYYQATFIYPT